MARQSPTSTPAQSAPIVEGLSGRLPILVSGLVFMLLSTLLFRLRSVFHQQADVIDFDTVGTWGSVGLLLIFVIAPLAHTLAHALALALMRQPLRVTRRLIYPCVRPTHPVSHQQATWILLAPLGLSLVLLGLMTIRSLSAFVVVWNAVNLGLWVNDAWKVLGLRRFSRKARVEMNRDHCRIVE